jgi:D-xylose transport system permease protein
LITLIINGLGLLGSKARAKFLLMGAALLLAAGVDAISRRRIANAS